MRLLLPAILVLLATGLAAQAASYTYIKQPNTTLGPSLTARNLPKIGTTFQVEVSSSWHRLKSNWIATGTRNPDILWAASGVWKFRLYTSAEFIQKVPSSTTGLASMNFRLPNDSALLGLRFYQQVLGWGGTFGHIPFLSRGGVGVIGR